MDVDKRLSDGRKEITIIGTTCQAEEEKREKRMAVKRGRGEEKVEREEIREI